MEPSPASPNVRYFVVFPYAYWEEDPVLGTSEAITRAAALALIAEPKTIATADITGFDWVYPGDLVLGEVIWTTPTPSFFPNEPPGITFQKDSEDSDIGTAIYWFSAYSGGGTNTPVAPDGGVNSLLVEITADNPALFDVTGETDFSIACSAGSDGGQDFNVSTTIFNLGTPPTPPYEKLEDHLQRIKVWRMPTRIFPPDPEPPSEFWTGFAGATEYP